MKIAYLILAYKYPHQLQRIFNRLDSPNCEFFVHIDKRSDISLFSNLSSKYSKIRFVKRENALWGRIGIVKAVINGLKIIPKKQFDYVSLITGQCYPIKSKTCIEDFFKTNFGKSYMSYFPLPSLKWLPHQGMDRINKYYFHFQYNRTFPPDESPKTFKERILNNIFQIYFKMPRKFPAYVKPYGGSAKFSLTMNNVEYILDFLRKHPDYIKFHDFTLFPDEIFFQTILLNATYNRISNIVADDLCYQDWSEKGAHPTIFRKKDFGTIINSGKLFARKFDSTVDSEILNMIDENIATGIDKVGISGLTFF